MTVGRQPLQHKQEVFGDDEGLAVKFGDSAAIDAFARLRVSNPATLFDAQLQYDESPLFWETVLAGSGTATHDPDNSAVDLDTTTAIGDKVTRQTRQYFRYQPGKSQRVLLTGALGVGQSNLSQRVGYFDDDNGIFFQCQDGILQVVLRSSTSGSAVDTVVPQSSWNLDKMDGSTPSGININPVNSQVFAIDLEWLSVGRVRMGFFVDGILVYCHQFLNANVITGAYMTTANLPARYEIENTGTIASAASLKQICTAVDSEGGFQEELGVPLSASNGITTIGVTTRRPILSIRPKATFNSIVNRGLIEPVLATLFAQTNAAFVELVYNGTLTGATFAIDPGGTAEADIAATAISGGLVIGSFPVATTGPGSNARSAGINPVLSKLPLTLDKVGATPIPLSMVVTSFNATSTVSGGLGWREVR